MQFSSALAQSTITAFGCQSNLYYTTQSFKLVSQCRHLCTFASDDKSHGYSILPPIEDNFYVQGILRRTGHCNHVPKIQEKCLQMSENIIQEDTQEVFDPKVALKKNNTAMSINCHHLQLPFCLNAQSIGTVFLLDSWQ